MAKRKERFYTEAQIIKKIDSALDRIKEYSRLAELAEDEVKRLALLSPVNADLDLKAILTKEKQKAKLARSRVKRIAKDLPRLSAKLAEFRTDTLPFEGRDKGLTGHDIPA